MLEGTCNQATRNTQAVQILNVNPPLQYFPVLPRGQVPAANIKEFEWTSSNSEAYRRARFPGETATPPSAAAKNTSADFPGDTSGAMLAKGNVPRCGNSVATTDAKHGAGGVIISSSSKGPRTSRFFGSNKIMPGGAEGLGDKGKLGSGAPNTQRRETHAGVIESGERRLSLNLVRFSPQAYMDPDTAAQVPV